MKDLLKKISEKFDEEADKIKNHITAKEEYTSDLFDALPTFTSIVTRPKKMRGKKGIYVFMITKPITLDHKIISAWNDVQGAGFKSYKQPSLVEGDCLYLGSSDSLFHRMTEHFSDNSGAASLKLSHNKRKIALDSVCVYSFALKEDYIAYSSMIITQIEKRLHNSMLPKAGSSKV
jgi:hypothetical protein